MKTHLMGLTLARCGGTFCADETLFIEQSRRHVKTYAEHLKSALQTSLQGKGVLAAVEHCHAVAPEIGEQLKQNDRQIARTALRVHNPLNKAHLGERKVLQRFERRRGQGEKIEDLEYHQVVAQDGMRCFRYMKAIPTQELCLTCHGEKLNDPLAAIWHRFYPNDQATGFKNGDIRGAFSVKRRLN